MKGHGASARWSSLAALAASMTYALAGFAADQPVPLTLAKQRVDDWLLIESNLQKASAEYQDIQTSLSKRVDAASATVVALLNGLAAVNDAIQTDTSAAKTAAASCLDAVASSATTPPTPITSASCPDPSSAQTRAKTFQTRLDSLKDSTTPPTTPPTNSVNVLLAARCKSALCFSADGRAGWLGIDPLIELPISKTFGIGSGTVANYIDNTGVRVDLAAGMRVWIFRDLISVSVYLSQVLAADVINVQGVDAQLPASNLKRPYPGIALGLLYDTLWLSLDRDELHNGSSQGNIDPHFPPNAVISSAWSITIGIQPITATRTGIAALAGATQKQ